MSPVLGNHWTARQVLQELQSFFFFSSFFPFRFFFFLNVDHVLKSLLNSLQYCFCFMFWFFGWKTYGILALQPGMLPEALHLEGEM